MREFGSPSAARLAWILKPCSDFLRSQEVSLTRAVRSEELDEWTMSAKSEERKTSLEDAPEYSAPGSANILPRDDVIGCYWSQNPY